jgi:nucleoside transporter
MPNDPATVRPRTLVLSVMMFLQFFLWGSWFVTLGPFMNTLKMGGGKGGEWIGNAYSTAPIAAILAPFFLGVVADRFFASQRVMGVLHLIGGLLLLAAPGVAKSSVENPLPFVAVLLGHMLCYMPTLGLSNTVAFNCMSNPEKQFPLIRVWGTIGWIVAGLAVGYLVANMFPFSQFVMAHSISLADFESARAAMAAKQTLAADVLEKVNGVVADTQNARNGSPIFFYIGGLSGIVLGLLCFALPNTPPPMKGRPVDVGAIFGRDALALLADRTYLVFIVSSLLVCIPLAAYYSLAGTCVQEFFGAIAKHGGQVASVPVTMSYGQMSEIFFMLVMPLFFARLGVKWMLAIGMLAWVVRYSLFAAAWGHGDPSDDLKWMIIGGILLHGICYDFFFVTGQIYTERKASPQIRGQAQGFLVLITQGVGMLIGNQVIGRLKDYETKDGVTNWHFFWMVPALFAAVVLLFFIAAFWDKKPGPSQAPGQG